MHFFTFIILTFTQLYIIILLLRLWIKCNQINLDNLFFQFIFKTTQPILTFFINKFKNISFIEIYIILLAYILTLLNVLFVICITNNINLININLLIVSLIQLLTYLGKLIFWIISIKSVLNLFYQYKNTYINHILLQLTQPLILLIRRFMPVELCGIDFSFFLITIVLIALNYLRLDILLFIDPNVTKLIYKFLNII